MTIFFIKPLTKLGSTSKVGWKASRLNEVALRTLVASIVCLIASFANIFALIMFKGRERGLVCLTCCTVDVTINVITVHWVINIPDNRRKIQTTHFILSFRWHHKHQENALKTLEQIFQHIFRENRSQMTMKPIQLRRFIVIIVMLIWGSHNKPVTKLAKTFMVSLIPTLLISKLHLLTILLTTKKHSNRKK